MNALCFASFAHACIIACIGRVWHVDLLSFQTSKWWRFHCALSENHLVYWEVLWNAQWIGPGYFHILLSLPCDCCTWYMFCSYLGRWHFIKSVRPRWHWSFQNLWPDVLVVFCQLLSVVSVLFQLVCFQNSHLMACISPPRFPICLPI